jgi:hypothetical protein
MTILANNNIHRDKGSSRLQRGKQQFDQVLMGYFQFKLLKVIQYLAKTDFVTFVAT